VETDVYDTKDIIYALATPWGNSALAVIRISGEGSLDRLATLFDRPNALHKAPSHSLVHGFLVDPLSAAHVDEVVVALFKDGRGYTGEESAELSVHGSTIGIEQILALLEHAGMRPAAPGEFTFRAFMHGRMDLTQAEAVREIVASRSNTARALALNRLEGALFARIEAIKQAVLDVLAAVEVQLDYAEDELPDQFDFPFDRLAQAKERLEALAATYHVGKLYAQGAKVVIAGSTNAGKSTLFNLLLRQERSIVSDQHGTTRDFIEAAMTVAGIPVRLYDTAGLREQASDSVEKEGIHRTALLLDQADLILLMIDGTEIRHASEAVKRLMDDKRCIVVWNKADVAVREHAPAGSIAISAKTGSGMVALLEEMARRLKLDRLSTESADVVIESQRQHDAVERALQAIDSAVNFARSAVPLDIVALDLSEAVDALGSLTGEVASDDILDRIFSGFCVGK
jgi:tRNA modification GTPase